MSFSRRNQTRLHTCAGTRTKTRTRKRIASMRISRADLIWFIVYDGSRQGPFSLIDLAAKLERREVNEQTIVTRLRSSGEWGTWALASVVHPSTQIRKQKNKSTATIRKKSNDVRILLLRQWKKIGRDPDIRKRLRWRHWREWAAAVTTAWRRYPHITALLASCALVASVFLASLGIGTLNAIFGRGSHDWRHSTSSAYKKPAKKLKMRPAKRLIVPPPPSAARPQSRAWISAPERPLRGCPVLARDGFELAMSANKFATLPAVRIDQAPVACSPCHTRAQLRDGTYVVLTTKSMRTFTLEKVTNGVFFDVCGKVSARSAGMVWFDVRRVRALK